MKTRILALLALLFTLASPAWAGVNSGVTPKSERATSSAQSAARAPVRPSYGSHGENKRYAQREASSKNAKKYRAGDSVVVISTTAAIIILLGVIIILLIT